MTNQFAAYMPKKTEHTYCIHDAYTYCSDRRLHWLQRLCLWVLDRLGCQDMRYQIRVTRATINFEDVADLIRQQARAMREISGRWPKYVILGAAQADELEMEDARQFAFHMPDGRDRFLGMIVIVAPYFDGVICLEELHIESIPGRDMDMMRRNFAAWEQVRLGR